MRDELNIQPAATGNDGGIAARLYGLYAGLCAAGVGGGIVIFMNLHVADKVVGYAALLFGAWGGGEYRHGAVYLVGICTDDFGAAQLLCYGNCYGAFAAARRPEDEKWLHVREISLDIWILPVPARQ